MLPKIVTYLYPYTPNQVPVDVGNIATFLADELERIANPLQSLVNTWEPPITVGLTGPQQPTTILTTPTDISAYQETRFNQYAAYLDIKADPDAGTVDLGGNSTDVYTIEVAAFFQILRNGITQNQEVLLYLTDGSISWIMGSDYIAEAQQSYLSLGSVRLLDVAADSILKCYLIASASAGNVTITGGNFYIRVVDSKESEVIR